MLLVKWYCYSCLCLFVIAASSFSGQASEVFQYKGEELLTIGRWSLVNNCGDFYLAYVLTSLAITFRYMLRSFRGMTVRTVLWPALFWSIYFTLGELGIPILPGTADPYDIPAALLGCFSPVLLSFMPGYRVSWPIVRPALLFALYFLGTCIGNYLYYHLS